MPPTQFNRLRFWLIIGLMLFASGLVLATPPAEYQTGPHSPVSPMMIQADVTPQAQVQTIYLPMIGKSPPRLVKGVSVAQIDDNASCYDAQILNADWWYNWDKTPRYGCSYSAGFVPMVWGLDPNYLWTRQYARASGWLMGFNEPDAATQSNISPRDGAIFWHDKIERDFAGVKLLSPAPSQFNPGWLKIMAREYETLYGVQPRFDAIGVHYYYGDINTAKRYIEARHAEWPNKKLWVTEFSSCLWIKDPDWRKTSALAEWMEQQPYIERYAWFVSRWNSVADTQHACTLIRDNQLTAPGIWFKSR